MLSSTTEFLTVKSVLTVITGKSRGKAGVMGVVLPVPFSFLLFGCGPDF